MTGFHAYFFDLATKQEHAQKLVRAGFVKQSTVDKAFNLSKNYTENQKIEYLYMIGFEFAGHVLNHYWNLKPYLNNKAAKLVRTKFGTNFVIGIQLRMLYLEIRDIDLFIECARHIEKQKRAITRAEYKVKWFITSDNQTIVEKLVEKYPDQIIVSEGLIGHIARGSNGYERALLDIQLLSMCNETILTGGSTYGFVAAMKSQSRPFVFEGKRNQTKCQRFEFFAPAKTNRNNAMF